MEHIPSIEIIYVVLHLLGLAIGMGGAIVSDAMFFSSIRDEKVSHTEMRFLRLGGATVWIGLVLIILSGILLFSLNPEQYLASGKFLAKMTIVSIIFFNGILFHVIHIPRLHRHAGHHFPSSDEFMRMAPILIVNGVISSVSWFTAFILGAIGRSPLSYFTIMSSYLFVLIVVATVSLVFKRKIVPHMPR